MSYSFPDTEPVEGGSLYFSETKAYQTALEPIGLLSMGVIPIRVCIWLCYCSTCVVKTFFPSKAHLFIEQIGIIIELL